MNIGVFSGSFNPIHMGHLMLANYIVEFTDLDEIWFLVTPQNPLKESVVLLDEAERFHMLQLALEGYDKLKASDFELSLPRPSYTITTLDTLSEKYANDQFSLIIGSDNWESFARWRDYETILLKYRILVYPRLGHRISIPNKSRGKVEALDSPILEVSSTFIRDCIHEGRNVDAFLPIKVNRYIKEKGLYK